MTGAAVPALVTVGVLAILALSRTSEPGGDEPEPPPEPIPPPPPPPPPPFPPPPPSPVPIPEVAKYDQETALREAQRVDAEYRRDGRAAKIDPAYACALANRFDKLVLPLGAQLLIGQRMRSISEGLGGSCPNLPFSPAPRDRTDVATVADGVGQIHAGECDYGALGKIIWPSDVDRFKTRIHGFFENMAAAVATCPSLPAGDRAAWARFAADWLPFRARPTPTFGSANEHEHACAFSATMDRWYEHLARYCTIPGAKPPTVAPKGGDTAAIVRWAAIGAIAIGALGLLVLYAPEIKAILPSGKS